MIFVKLNTEVLCNGHC